MGNYLNPVVESIRSLIPPDRVPDTDGDDLLRTYAVLALAKGENTTLEDVHNAWSAWIVKRDPQHQSLVPFSDLTDEVKAEDQVFTSAIKETARALNIGTGSNKSFEEILFPHGDPPAAGSNAESVFSLYKMMVESSESLVGRRQAVNTFFLTANGALVAAYGIIAKNVVIDPLTTVGLSFLAGAGVLISFAWRSLISSFGQLNTGKFRVINAMERHLPAAIYEAEWEALGRGEDPKIYKSFTEREIWVPSIFVWIHGFIAVGSLVYAAKSSEEFRQIIKTALTTVRSLF